MEFDMEQKLAIAQNHIEDLTRKVHRVKDMQRSLHSPEILTVTYDLSETAENLLCRHQEVSRQFHTIQSLMESITKELSTRVASWHRELQLVYAELTDKTKLKIDDLKTWCGKGGQLINEVINNCLNTWTNVLSEIKHKMLLNEQRITAAKLTQTFERMMKDFVRSTFVVTEQGKGFHVKTGNKTFLKFSIRILALERIPKTQAIISAHFLSEDEINDCYNENMLDIDQVKRSERKLKCSTKTFQLGVDAACKFDDLQFLHTFKRKQDKDQKQVHEEKHRVVFVASINSDMYWTLSLPFLVITASNQEVHCLASIMWQCFSTNVFELPINIPETLPWKRIAEMLKVKMERLSTSHTLTDDNVEHLKYRLFGHDGVSDEENVTLNLFCWTPMAGTDEERPFSFWKWFLAIYNLIQKFLKPYWNDGLIVGFIKRETAKQMLENNSDKMGTFILRFSDKYITPSDGVKGVFGHLTSCVRITDPKGYKRKHMNGTNGTYKKETVECFEVANCSRLKNESSLANILRETWVRNKNGTVYQSLYCYHYPSNQTRAELFDKHGEEVSDTIGLKGYKLTTDAGILCLEQHLHNVNIKDQDDHTTPDENIPDEKKLKSSPVSCPNISEIQTSDTATTFTSTAVLPYFETQSTIESHSPPYPSHNVIIPTVVQQLQPVQHSLTSSNNDPSVLQQTVNVSNVLTETCSSLQEVIKAANLNQMLVENEPHISIAGQDTKCVTNTGTDFSENQQSIILSESFVDNSLIVNSIVSDFGVVGANEEFEAVSTAIPISQDQPLTDLFIPQDHPAIEHLNALQNYLTQDQFLQVYEWVFHKGESIPIHDNT